MRINKMVERFVDLIQDFQSPRAKEKGVMFFLIFCALMTYYFAVAAMAGMH